MCWSFPGDNGGELPINEITSWKINGHSTTRQLVAKPRSLASPHEVLLAFASACFLREPPGWTRWRKIKGFSQAQAARVARSRTLQA